MSDLAKSVSNVQAASMRGRPVALANVHVPVDEWPFAVTEHPNLLLEGNAAAAAAVITALAPYLRSPIDCWDGKPPASRPATLLLYEASAMDSADQQLLMQWL